MRKTISPSFRCDQPPTTRPSHQTVGPAFPFRSKSSRRAGRGTSPAPSSPSSSGRASAGANGRRLGRGDGSEVVREDEPGRRRPGRRRRGELRRARRAPRAPSSRSTSGCRSRSPARTPRASGGAALPGRSRYPARRPDPARAPSGTGRASNGREDAPGRSFPRPRAAGAPVIAALTSASQRVPAPRRILVASSGSARVRSEVNASPRSLSASSAAAAARSIQTAGSSARPLCATNRSRLRPLAGRDGSRARGVDDRREVERHDPERPAHPEHPHERALVVERLLEGPRAEVERARPGREEHRRRIGGVQRDERPGDLQRARCPGLGGQPVAPREPRSPLLHTDALHARLLPGRLHLALLDAHYEGRVTAYASMLLDHTTFEEATGRRGAFHGRR